MPRAYIKKEHGAWCSSDNSEEILSADSGSLIFVDEDHTGDDILALIQEREPTTHSLLTNLFPVWSNWRRSDGELPKTVDVVDEHYDGLDPETMVSIGQDLNGKAFRVKRGFNKTRLAEKGIVLTRERDVHGSWSLAAYHPEEAEKILNRNKKKAEAYRKRQKYNIPPEIRYNISWLIADASRMLRNAGMTGLDLQVGKSFTDNLELLVQAVRLFDGICGENTHRRCTRWVSLMEKWRKDRNQAKAWLKRNSKWDREIAAICGWLDREAKEKPVPENKQIELVKFNLPKLYRGQK